MSIGDPKFISVRMRNEAPLPSLVFLCDPQWADRQSLHMYKHHFRIVVEEAS